MSPRGLLYLSRADVETIALGLPSILGLLEEAFKEKAYGRVEMPPKPGIHTQPDSFIHAMPAFIPSLRSAGIKWVSGYPENQRRGLPYISGLLVLNDVETGMPYTVMDCTWITAYRTAAASALSAKYLCRRDSEVIGILACGVQGRTNLLAMSLQFPLKRAYAYDVIPEAQQRYVDEMATQTNLEIVPVNEPKEAVVESDIVVTSGPILKHPIPTIGKDWLKPGAFASAVDFDSYWNAEALAQIDKLTTDDHEQFQYYRGLGYFHTTQDPYADLGELVAGIKPGRENDRERTMAVNLGLALDDMAVAPEVYRRAVDRGIGTWLEL